jgi:hypothetical protein
VLKLKKKYPILQDGKNLGMKSLAKFYLVEMSFQCTIRLIYPSTAALSVASLGTTLQELKIMLPSKLSVCEVTRLIPLDC